MDELLIAQTLDRMIAYSSGNRHDINHLVKVHALARTIGRLEGLDARTQQTLELAAIVHDISCPLCRERYGSTAGNLQEQESEPLVRAFFEGVGLPSEQLERIVFVVCHHHTYAGVEGQDWRILLEADFLVNADESALKPQAIARARKRVFATEAGRRLLDAIYPEAAELR